MLCVMYDVVLYFVVYLCVLIDDEMFMLLCVFKLFEVCVLCGCVNEV